MECIAHIYLSANLLASTGLTITSPIYVRELLDMLIDWCPEMLGMLKQARANHSPKCSFPRGWKASTISYNPSAEQTPEAGSRDKKGVPYIMNSTKFTQYPRTSCQHPRLFTDPHHVIPSHLRVSHGLWWGFKSSPQPSTHHFSAFSKKAHPQN